MSQFHEAAQSLSPGERIALYRFDTRKAGGGEYFFYQGSKNDGSVFFGGVEYHPVDIEVSGFEVNAGGALPTPTIKVSNTDAMAQQIVNTYGDLLGCVVQRIRTFSQFLDGASQADPAAYLGADTFEIERKVDENKTYIEWQLSASIDQEGKMLPGRVVVRDTCLWRYRRWTGAGWDYSKVQCPYVSNVYFDRSGNQVASPHEDQCGRRLSDCEQRFGKQNPLPFGGFPGAARLRG